MILDAERDLVITAARNTGDSSFQSESGGGKIGVSVTGGPNGPAFGLNLAANAAGAKASGNQQTHTNAQIVAGDTLYTSSGRDTTIAGAHLEGDKVWMDVGGDLTVASLQDSYESESSSWNAGLDVTVGYGVNVSGSLGFGQGKADSNWVGQQTSIVGKSEVDIYVKGNTHLKGSIIATEKGGDLILDTGSLTYEEIHDSSTSSDWHAGISGGMNIGSGGFDKPAGDTDSGSTLKDFFTPKPFDYTNGGKHPYVPDSVEATYSSSDKEGVLRPTVTEGTIIVRDDPDADLGGLNRDIDRAREITKDESTYVDVYVSPGAIETVIDGLGEVVSAIEEYAEAAAIDEIIQREFADSINDAFKDSVKKLLQAGYSSEDIQAVLNAKGEGDANLGVYVSLISQSNQQGYIVVDKLHNLGNEYISDDPAVRLFYYENGTQMVLESFAKANSIIQTLTPEQQQIALFALDAATGGPVRAILNQAKDKVLELAGVSEAIGEYMGMAADWIAGQLYGEVYTKDWSGEPTIYQPEEIEYRKEYLKGGASLALSLVVGGVVSKAGNKLGAKPDSTLAGIKHKIDDSVPKYIEGVTVVDKKMNIILTGTVNLDSTFNRINSGVKFPHKNDGIIFRNDKSILPQKELGYYTEFVHPTPGVSGPGVQRIVLGKNGEVYYTPDHYGSFIQLK